MRNLRILEAEMAKPLSKDELADLWYSAYGQYMDGGNAMDIGVMDVMRLIAEIRRRREGLTEE